MKKFLIIFLATTLLSFNLSKATFYAPKFEGRLMANGQIFHQEKMIAASNMFDLGTVVKLTNLFNGKSIIVEVQDRTAQKYHGIDLSTAAFKALGVKEKRGWTFVMVQIVRPAN
jgi:rare lipoprotein A